MMQTLSLKTLKRVWYMPDVEKKKKKKKKKKKPAVNNFISSHILKLLNLNLFLLLIGQMTCNCRLLCSVNTDIISNSICVSV
jgi:hypothetical protein